MRYERDLAQIDAFIYTKNYYNNKKNLTLENVNNYLIGFFH